MDSKIITCLIYFQLLSSFNVCNGVNIIDLNNHQWFVKDVNNNYNGLPAKVPGGIYTDLMNNNVIGDIQYGSNDTHLKWIGKTSWIYYRNVSVEEMFLDNENINIVFEGLDTHSTIFINDEFVGDSRNMFVRYIFDIKHYIKPGINTIKVIFDSPVEKASNLTKKQNYTIPPECPPDIYNGECHVNQLRKMQASFSWDWGPSFPSVGIWKPVIIEGYNSSVIRYVTVNTTVDKNDSWQVTVQVYLASNARNLIDGSLKILLETDLSTIQENVFLNQTDIVVNVTITIPQFHVKLWWPNGYGDQKLYNLTAIFTHSGNNEKSEKSVMIGFRTIELIQNEIDSGMTFYFKVNGVPIFGKGSNSIPIDILPERGQDKDKILYLLQSAKDSHFNMLRVWGGGVYESDFFYETCDKFGIMIWQDFMFACSMYPTYDDYLNNVVEEVRHQTKRLNYHPSICLWAGNNENELALVGNWYNTASNFNLYKDDYLKLYIDTIKEELSRSFSGKIFLSSSPTNGRESEQEGFVAKQPGSSFYGDVHFYNYIFDGLDVDVYPIPRFASEYGYQSLPSVESFLQVTDQITDLNINSTFMQHRQHHPLGNIELIRLMNNIGTLDSESSEYYKDFIYCSQIIQAMSIKIETEHYRAYKSILQDDGKGLTMGALYWQLNDVWVAPTWSGMDYFGRWKMLQYYIKDSFSPLLVAGFVNAARELNVYTVSDLQTNIPSASLHIQVYNTSSFDALNETVLTTNIDQLKSQLVFNDNVDNYLSSAGCGSVKTARRNCFIILMLEQQDQIIAPVNFVFADEIKRVNFLKANVQVVGVSEMDDSGKSFTISLQSDKVAAFVWLDTHGIPGRFSENGALFISPRKDVHFTAEVSTDSDSLYNSITVTHLKDVTFIN